MAWEIITEAMMQEKMHANEWTKLGGKFAEAVVTTVNLVRGYVASSGADLDPDTIKVPDRLIGPACDYLLVELYKLNGGVLVDPKDARKEAKRDALKLFERVADGKFSIDDPVTGGESKEAATPSYRPTRRRRYDRSSQDGI